MAASDATTMIAHASRTHVEDLGRRALGIGQLRGDGEQLRRRPEQRVEVGREAVPRAVLEPHGEAGGDEVEHDRGAPRGSRCGCESAAAPPPSRARCARRGRRRAPSRRIIAAAGDGTAAARLAARAEVPGERRAAAVARRAEGDADAEVVVAAVEQDRPVRRASAATSARSTPGSRGRRCPRRSSRPAPTTRRRRSSRRDRCAPWGSSPSASRARRSSWRTMSRLCAAAARSSEPVASQRAEPVVAARLVDQAHGRADRSIERRWRGAAACAGAGGRGGGRHERARH